MAPRDPFKTPPSSDSSDSSPDSSPPAPRLVQLRTPPNTTSAPSPGGRFIPSRSSQSSPAPSYHSATTVPAATATSSTSVSPSPTPSTTHTASTPAPTPPPSYPLPKPPVGPRRKSPKTPTTPKSRLGVIDEHSDAISPDVPDRHPRRKFGIEVPKIFTLQSIPTLHGKREVPPHRNIYDDVEGPRGEKFSDLRSNKRSSKEVEGQKRKFCGLAWTWRIWVCLGVLILVIIVALVVGLVVGLKVRDRNSQNDSSIDSSSNSNNNNAALPAGAYSISTYLNNVSTSCTTNSATWRCYPYVTYSTSTTNSLSTLNWNITLSSSSNNNNNNNDPQYVVSSDDPLFNYPFQNIPLKLLNPNTSDESYTFTTTFTKTVVPSSPITSDGSQARCFYYNATLNAILYTRKQKATALQNSTATTSSSSSGSGSGSSGNGLFQPWPYALQYTEVQAPGDAVPDCYKWVNGAKGERVDVATGQGNCRCSYANYF